jgi:hypothetical protein
LWRALRFAPDKLFFDHLREVVIAIVMLEDATILPSSASSSKVFTQRPFLVTHYPELREGSAGHPPPPAPLSRTALELLP